MSYVQSSADPEVASPETNDKAIEPVVMSKPGDQVSPHTPLELPSSPHRSPPLQLGSSPHQSPPLQLGHQSPPLALRPSPHQSPSPQQLDYQGPQLALHSSPYRSPSPAHRSSSSSGSQSPHYSPTLHQSLSPSPPNSPPRRQQNPPHHIPPETPASVPPTTAAVPAAEEPTDNDETGTAYENPELWTEPLPTKVDAYKPRGIRNNKLNALSIANVALRAFAAVFTLISFSVIASDKDTFVVTTGFFSTTITLRFKDLFYLSYLLTANVIAFVYVVVTTGIFMYYMNTGKPMENVQLFVGVFALDQILSYLLMSASTSAATGIRAQRAIIEGSALDSFESQAYAGVAMSFVAFFLLAAASLISGHHVVNRKRLTF